MVAAPWVPKRGDIVMLDSDPTRGHEQAGHRPALVVSDQEYNQIGLALVCPITNQVKGYPFEVPLPKGGKITGAILTDQVRCIDWQERAAYLKAKVSHDVLSQVQRNLRLLFGMT